MKVWVLAVVLVGGIGAVMGSALGGEAGSGSGVTLRVAPTGFVVPTEHWALGGAPGSPPAAWVVDPVSVTTFNGQPGVAGCTVTVVSGASGADVLDAATSTGCISGWDYITFSCCGRFVTMVDGLWKSNATTTGWPVAWWQILLNGELADQGVDGLSLTAGDELSFVYAVGP